VAARKPSRLRVPLTQESIVAASVDVLEEVGLEAFSTRKLAERLGCEAMSIYHHFPSKAHLMDALVDRFVQSIPIPPADLAWHQRLRDLTVSWRAATMRQPEFFRYFVVHRLNTPTALKFLDSMLSIYFDAGFETEDAARFFRLTGYYVTGGLLDESSGYAHGPSAANPPSNETVAREFPRIVAAAPYFQKGSYEKTLDIGLELLIAGFERTLEESRRRKGGS
jgi:AcrR family transcriptional regulator